METTQILKNNNQASTSQNTAKLFPFKTTECQNEMHDHFSGQSSKHRIYYYNFNENGTPVLQNYEKDNENCFEEPIDLTCNEKRKIELPSASNNVKFNLKKEPQAIFISNTLENIPKKRGRKRKLEHKLRHSFEEIPLPLVEANLLKNIQTSHYAQNDDNKKVEVLKAAKSLFSKRTRTLYHWMYPNAPKSQLKAAIATSWETLGLQEKEFYISQVLGRFGYPQSNLMINPQLEGISGALSLSSMGFSTLNAGNEETSSAVSTILHENHKPWIADIDSSSTSLPSYSPYREINQIKCGKRGKSKNKSKKDVPILKEVNEEGNDEFRDDPELSREFQQFKWNLHLNDD